MQRSWRSKCIGIPMHSETGGKGPSPDEIGPLGGGSGHTQVSDQMSWEMQNERRKLNVGLGHPWREHFIGTLK
eukprot:4907285-Pyramimonas_sp.AAC.1